MRFPIIGIDPGLTGAIAFISSDGATVGFIDTPIVVLRDGKKTKRLYDRAAMADALRDLVARNPGINAVIEQVHAMPKQGVASSFNFGTGYGLWLGILAALQVPHTLVTPQNWTKALLAGKPAGDEAAVIRCGELYPTVAGQLRTPRGALHLGRADALLIAHHGATLLG